MAVIEVRDERRRGWFAISNEVVDAYGPQIGANGLAVYAVLARFADSSTREAHPSHERIAKLTVLSRRTVINSLNKLRDVGLIAITKRYTDNAAGGRRQMPSLYTLLTPSTSASVHLVHTGQCAKTQCAPGAHKQDSSVNKTQQQQREAKSAAAADSLTPSQTGLMSSLASFGVTGNRRSLAIVRRIADKPRVLEVVREQWAQIEANHSARNKPAVLLSVLDSFDFDAAAVTPKAKPADTAVAQITGGKRIAGWREVDGAMAPILEGAAND